MGVRWLDTFIREEVKNGAFLVNIEHEIREYYSKATAAGSTSPPPPPVLVIDVFALSCGQLSSIDFDALIYGARFNVGFGIIDRFLRKLKSLGVVLEFFIDGSVQSFKVNTWSERRDQEYRDIIAIIDAVDRGTDVATILDTLGAPGCSYSLKYLAETHGRLTVSLEKECDQELAAFACKVNALAIISNDTDFLVYEGSWKFWSSNELNIDTLETLEYNRQALLETLGLTFAQMPLFATLCGNDIIKAEELKRFHYRIGRLSRKISNVAQFVQQEADLEDLDSTLLKVFGRHNAYIRDRFRQSIDFYKTDYATTSDENNNPVKETLLKHANTLVYQLWHKQPHMVSMGLVDMRDPDLGQPFPTIVLRILQRTAGIIMFHRLKGRKYYAHPFVVKLNHETGHQLRRFPVQFPTFVDPPTMTDLFSKNPSIEAKLEEVKFLLLSWIVSDRLDYRLLKRILRPLLPTVVTLCNLVENRMLRLFEADLLLQVAYDVVTEAYDPKLLELPPKVEPRPFRVPFLFRSMYAFVIDAMDSIGMNLRGFREDPPLDGVLFHLKYEEWAKLAGSTERIAPWRIYVTLMRPEVNDGKLLK
ncbi:uncharacterized protein LOC109408717 [Aedes albopictus]|uniref:Asteroid domain-containing protein n=1 Tax=Aedes albopictus TaxID=7160 RepID=A0ABM1XW96_AEDAL